MMMLMRSARFNLKGIRTTTPTPTTKMSISQTPKYFTSDKFLYSHEPDHHQSRRSSLYCYKSCNISSAMTHKSFHTSFNPFNTDNKEQDVDVQSTPEPMIGEERDATIIDQVYFVEQRHVSINQEDKQSTTIETTTVTQHAIGQLEQYMAAEFTCAKCNTHNTHVFTKATYDTGEVIVRCPGCKHLHLIADNKGWFGEEKNIEEIMKHQGKTVRRLHANQLDADEKASKNLSVIEEMIQRRQSRRQMRILAEEQKLKEALSKEAERESV